MKLRYSILTSFLLFVALTAVSGCKKHQPLPPAEATAPAPAAAPTAQLTATPTVISAGDQVQLTWQTTNYHLVARGEGGSADASAHVTVNAPPAVSVPSTSMTEEEEFSAHVQPIFFDYDNYDIRPDAQATLAKNADYLVAHPNIKIVIGGYCDERGSDEYNLVLGQNRATGSA